MSIVEIHDRGQWVCKLPKQLSLIVNVFVFHLCCRVRLPWSRLQRLQSLELRNVWDKKVIAPESEGSRTFVYKAAWFRKPKCKFLFTMNGNMLPTIHFDLPRQVARSDLNFRFWLRILLNRLWPVIRELKHRRRNPRTTTTGSLISRFVCTTHVRVCEWVVHISTRTAFYMEFRSPENVSKRGVPEALFARSLFLFAKLYTWMTKRMWLHHTELCFLLLLQDNIASVYIANMAAALPQGEIEKT